MKSDLEIAKESKIKPIEKIASSVSLSPEEIDFYGKHIAKVKLSAYKKREKQKDGKLILVTTITPTPLGEGKTTMTIGLAQALKKINKKSFVCIREPSLGPTLGIKGGACGGGYSQVIPMEDINLHFTGDMHMVSSANNFLSAMIDNHLYFGNELSFDINNILWKRSLDMNDRALRDITLNYKDFQIKTSFDISAASEIMAILCLSTDLSDLRDKLSSIIVGFDKNGRPITSANLKADGAMSVLLKEAIKPNLVQTIEGVPAFVHGGPFANIAHGCNSLISTKLALKLSDYVITEAGFGSDLGAEKFFNIKCRKGNLNPNAIVLVVTMKALKWHAGVDKESIREKNEDAVIKGLDNMALHLDGLKNYSLPVLIAINKFSFDYESEINLVLEYCKKIGLPCSVCDVRESGGSGGIDLAKKLVEIVDQFEGKYSLLYEDKLNVVDKLIIIARKIYHAKDVILTEHATKDLNKIEDLGLNFLPICVAKTQFSFTDDHTKIGAQTNHTIKIKNLKISAGAGFIVAYAGDIMTMPGLPKHPASENFYIDDLGEIHGLF